MASNTNSQYECKDCKLIFRCEKHLTQHEQGKRHLKQTAVPVTSNCSVCLQNFNSELQLKAHLDGSKHYRNVLINSNDKKDNKVKPDGFMLKEGVKFKCAVCLGIKLLNGESDYIRHSLTGRHQKAVNNRRNNVDTISPERHQCVICEVSMNNSTEIEEHIAGRKHRNKMKSMNLSQSFDTILDKRQEDYANKLSTLLEELKVSEKNAEEKQNKNNKKMKRISSHKPPVVR